VTLDVPAWAAEITAGLGYPPAFATVSGAHLLNSRIPRLRAELEAARDASALPDQADPAAVEALHDLVVRVRLSRPADAVDQICG
jgi:hypothetical protein